MTVRTTDKELLTLVEQLHERAVLNGNALVSVLHALADNVPLTRAHLAAIFGRETLVQLLGTAHPVDPVRLMQLDEIRAELLGADDHDALVRAFLQLITVLERSGG